MSEWKDISTAPKDGAEVLLWVPSPLSRQVIVGRWDQDKYAQKPRPYWTNDRERLWGITHTRTYQPTHWMPLPEPPK